MTVFTTTLKNNTFITEIKILEEIFLFIDTICSLHAFV